VLERVDRDRALARLGVVVRGEALARLVGPVPGLPEAGPRDLLRGESPRGIHLGQLEVRRVRIVVGHRPADDHGPARRLRRGGLLDLARELMHVGRDEIADAHPDEVVHAAGRDVDHARVGGEPVELRHHPERGGELVAARQRVQERGVHRVHAVVLHLEPVARQRELGRGHQGMAGHLERVVERKRGPSIGWAQVREDEPAVFMRGIRALPHALAQATARGLARRLETAPVGVVYPAVVTAAQAALERNAELERRAAMRAVQVEHADAPAAIAEDHEILAEDAHAARRSVQVAREGHRLPEAPQVFAPRSAWTDLGELGIGSRRRPAHVSVERAPGRGLQGHECPLSMGPV
jgi:hypothetical protein